MISLFLTFAGATLFVNGIWMWGSQSKNLTYSLEIHDIAIINLFTATVGLILVSADITLGTSDVLHNYSTSAYIGLFVLTYLWLGVNQFTGANGKALGWFSLLVPFIGIPAGFTALQSAHGVFENWLALNWFAWSALWFAFFLLLALGRNISRITAVLTVVTGIATALLPVILFFNGAI